VVFRCDAEGNAADDSSFCSVSARLSFSSLGGENSCSLTAALCPKYGDFGAENPLESGKSGVIAGAEADRSYQLRISAVDALGNSVSALRFLPTRRWAMKFSQSASAVAFGKAPEFDKCLEIPADWEIRRGEEILPWSIPEGSIGAELLSPELTELLSDRPIFRCIWENASPSSSFAPQTVSVDTSGYRWLAIVYRMVSSSYRGGVRFLSTASMGDISHTMPGSSAATIRVRRFGVASGGFQVYAGYKITGSLSAAEDNTAIIPVTVFGVGGI